MLELNCPDILYRNGKSHFESAKNALKRKMPHIEIERKHAAVFEKPIKFAIQKPHIVHKSYVLLEALRSRIISYKVELEYEIIDILPEHASISSVHMHMLISLAQEDKCIITILGLCAFHGNWSTYFLSFPYLGCGNSRK